MASDIFWVAISALPTIASLNLLVKATANLATIGIDYTLSLKRVFHWR